MEGGAWEKLFLNSAEECRHGIANPRHGGKQVRCLEHFHETVSVKEKGRKNIHINLSRRREGAGNGEVK